jgi:hypothetical protein
MTRPENPESHDAVLGLVAKSFDDVHMDREPAGILMRGGSLRRRRRAVPAIAATGAAAAIALAVVLPSTGTGTSAITAAGRQAVNVDLAAWSVHTSADASVTLTVREIKDTDRLRAVLAQAGIPAYVWDFTVGSAPPACRGENGMPQLVQVLQPHRVPGTKQTSVTIDPAKMPKGSALVITVITYDPPSADGVTRTVGFELIRDDGKGGCPMPAPVPVRTSKP